MNGISTNQIKNAPASCIYVVHSSVAIPYFKGLAEHLNRFDITIRTKSSVFGPQQLYRGYREIVVDHYALETMSRYEFDMYQAWQQSKR